MVFNVLPLKIFCSINSIIGEEWCFELLKEIKLEIQGENK
jgi:hypothetical protein